MFIVIEERSAGAVVFYLVNLSPITPEYLLLHYEAGHWDFPKGQIELGEEELDTVRREVREETGIEEIEILPNFRQEIQYFYKKLGELVRKRVVFYIGRSRTKEVRLSYEHKGYAWLNYANAMRRLTFRTARSVLESAHQYILQVYKLKDTP
ncbi:MAG: NUDIX domain-containing protein [Nitrososphaerota archaeon]